MGVLKQRQMKKKIQTTHNGRELSYIHFPPPIPSRKYDWNVTYKDWDLNDPIEYGSTPDEALEDLKEQTNNE